MEKIQADRDIAQVGLAKGQLEINKEEAKSGSIFIAGWRPAIGWIGVFAMAYQFVLYPFLVWGTELVIAVWGTELFRSRLSIEELESNPSKTRLATTLAHHSRNARHRRNEEF